MLLEVSSDLIESSRTEKEISETVSLEKDNLSVDGNTSIPTMSFSLHE
jgi:hypothetical protein